MQYKTNGWDVEQLYKYIRMNLDIFILIKVPPKFVIKENLRDVYVYFIISQVIGLKISSKEANNFVTDMLGYKDPSIIYNYKTNLRRKGWFIKGADKRYSPIQAFDYESDTMLTKTEYKFTVEYLKKDTYTFIDSKRKMS